jgi:hypothetical protein
MGPSLSATSAAAGWSSGQTILRKGCVGLGAKKETIALCDAHTWWLLSHDLGLERSEVHAILSNLIERLLAQERKR